MRPPAARCTRRAILASTFAPSITALIAALPAGLLPVPAQAADPYPTRPIRIVVPYPAGGTTDQLARAIQRPLAEVLGQAVIVENKPGAGGTIGTDAVVKSPPDGYTLVFGNSGPNAIVSLVRKVPYDPLKDLQSISVVALVPLILAVPADSPAKTLREFIALARARSDWNYGSVGNGSLSHLAGEFFNDRAGLKLTHIAYNGGAPMVTAFASGQLHAAFVTGLDGAAMMQAGRIRYLAVGTPQRSAVVPSLPAVAEEAPGFQAVGWFGLLAPRGLPAEIADRLNDAVVKAVARPDVVKLLADRNVEARSGPPEDLERLIRDELQQWGEVVRKSSITAD
jgi:tripartite-type tricarboxylate transporter receptor subunit TctC